MEGFGLPTYLLYMDRAQTDSKGPLRAFPPRTVSSRSPVGRCYHRPRAVPEDGEGGPDERIKRIQCPCRRREIRGELWLGIGNRNFLYRQPLDPVGDHPWDFQLAVRRLLRPVPHITRRSASPTGTSPITCTSQRPRPNRSPGGRGMGLRRKTKGVELTGERGLGKRALAIYLVVCQDGWDSFFIVEGLLASV